MSRTQEPAVAIEDMGVSQMIEFARQKERECNDAHTRAEQAERRAALATTTNMAQRGRPSKRQRVATSGSDDENDEANESDEEEKKASPQDQVKTAGKKYAIIYCLWLTSTPRKTLQTKLVDGYSEENRYKDLKKRIQGDMRDVRETLPEDFRALIGRDWDIHKYRTGMQDQRSNTSSRIRNDINPVFEDHLEGQIDGTIRINDATKRAGWTHLIGGKRDADGKLNYSALDAAVLHSDMSTTYKEATFLKNKLPMHVAAAILYGKQKAIALAAGAACATSGPVMKDIHQLTHTTPGLIANAAIVTMWALSADIQLKEEGQQTGVPWRAEHERVMVLLTGGLRERMRTTIEIFRAWDEELFPHTETSLGGAMGTGKPAQDLQDALAALLQGERMPEEEDEGSARENEAGTSGSGNGSADGGAGSSQDGENGGGQGGTDVTLNEA
ncbi:hypothetical protein FB45DRAFT_1036577 [Roridomyces roridus]|uniref:Uncharacterized protein n=1 Tax=Roridomyces roridus TaxID=1738132 RepID=A0AAD7B7N9_9AGAR|nr:hypothetical protein FB45DRAFT_1036577 [Roridomyces roridus]